MDSSLLLIVFATTRPNVFCFFFKHHEIVHKYVDILDERKDFQERVSTG